MIGGNVTNDFLDNLAANQYQRQADRDRIKDLQWQLKTAKKTIDELQSEIIVLRTMKL